MSNGTCEECGADMTDYSIGRRRYCRRAECVRAARVRNLRNLIARTHGVPVGHCVRCREAMPDEPGVVRRYCSGCTLQHGPRPRPKASPKQFACLGCAKPLIKKPGRGRGPMWCGDECWREHRGAKADRLEDAAESHPGVLELREARASVAVAFLSFRRSLHEHLHGPGERVVREYADGWAGYVSPAGW